jgi:hypothetical protein
LKSLELLCLLENPITYKSYYRQYVIYCLPQLKTLDFLKITRQERQEINDFFQKNHAGKQLLVEIAKEKEDYYRSLQQKLSAGAAAASSSSSSSQYQSGQSHAPPRPAGPPPAAQTGGVGKLQLTEEQREEVKKAIENASTREEIDMIEQQLKVSHVNETVANDLSSYSIFSCSVSSIWSVLRMELSLLNPPLLLL